MNTGLQGLSWHLGILASWHLGIYLSRVPSESIKGFILLRLRLAKEASLVHFFFKQGIPLRKDIMSLSNTNPHVSISPLLKRLAYPLAAEIQVEASEIASAFALIFEDRLNVVQSTALLTLLHSTRKDKDPAVIAQCSLRMREAASQIERATLRRVIRSKALKRGGYRGGLVRKSFL
jgi:hypothetical protein